MTSVLSISDFDLTPAKTGGIDLYRRAAIGWVLVDTFQTMNDATASVDRLCRSSKRQARRSVRLCALARPTPAPMAAL